MFFVTITFLRPDSTILASFLGAKPDKIELAYSIISGFFWAIFVNEVRSFYDDTKVNDVISIENSAFQKSIEFYLYYNTVLVPIVFLAAVVPGSKRGGEQHAAV